MFNPLNSGETAKSPFPRQVNSPSLVVTVLVTGIIDDFFMGAGSSVEFNAVF